MIKRGELWWADLGDPRGSEPTFRRPVLVIQNDDFNRSKLATVLVVSLTTNKAWAELPGNVVLEASKKLLDKASVINVSQLTTIDRSWLDVRIGKVPTLVMDQVDFGLGLVLGLG